jgi:hypothetical protein
VNHAKRADQAASSEAGVPRPQLLWEKVSGCCVYRRTGVYVKRRILCDRDDSACRLLLDPYIPRVRAVDCRSRIRNLT